MKNMTMRRLRVASGKAMLIPMLAAGLVAYSGSSYAQTQEIEQTDADLTPCGTYNAEALDHRPIPESIGGPGLLDSIAKDGFKTPATMLGAPDALDPVWYTEVKITPEQAKKICDMGLTAVHLDWDAVPYNLAMRSGSKDVFSALGIKVRYANYSFNANGMAGVLAAILPLNPDILITGGTVNAAQFAAILKPALDQGITVVSWSLGSPTMKVGQDQPLKAIVTYDFYNLGLQMADAIHETWPDGANFGYIHWINDVDAIHARENGLLDGLKKYPNIKIITNGDPEPGNPASGYTDPSSATAFTQAFLTQHPDVNVLFAPWEDPPAIGQAAGIRALGLQDKVKIATMDLGNAGANQMRNNGIIAMDMAQDVYDGGRLMAMTAALAHIGENKHSFVMVPTFPVTTKTNMVDAWDFMHGKEVTCP
jgi:ribose transport system substrate-binding protein